MMQFARGVLVATAVAALLVGCAPPPEPPQVLSKQSPVALRAMQIRVFDTKDKRRLVQAAIATLQDLGYTVDKIDYTTGTLSATKLIQLRMTVAIYPRGSEQYAVRANAMVRLPQGTTQVDDPKFYQTLFFEPLGHALALSPVAGEDDPSAPTALPSPASTGPNPAPSTPKAGV